MYNSPEFINPQTDTVSYPNFTMLFLFSFSVVHRQADGSIFNQTVPFKAFITEQQIE